MSTRVDIEEIESTKSEKVLAVVLAVFVLIGGIWTYQKIDDYVAHALVPAGEVRLSPADRGAIDRFNRAQAELGRAVEQERLARQDLELKREAYRTALEAGQPAQALERDYRSAQAQLEQAQVEARGAREAVRAVQPAANVAFRHQEEAFREQFDRHELAAFLFRLGLVVGVILFSYWLLAGLRRRNSHYLPLGLALVAAAAILAFLMAGDYITDFVDPLDFGPLILSVVGIAVTFAAFAGLQRYLARKIPFRRVRKQECPFCGYPFRGNEHCEGCGRQVVGECTSCSGPRRVGTLHCGVCGQA